MKKYLASALILILCFALMTSASAQSPQPSPFVDVHANDWFFEAVLYVHDNQIMQGTAADTFSPNADMSRAMAAATLFRHYHGRPATDEDIRDQQFSDIPPDLWFAPYVTWAYVKGIIGGVGNERFAPHESVTREQFVTMLHRFAQPDYWVSVQMTFPDAAQLSAWAEDALHWAVAGDIIRGANGMLNPGQSMSRAECAVMLLRFSRYIEGDPNPPVPLDFHVRRERTDAFPSRFPESEFPSYPLTIRSMDELSAHLAFYSEHVLWWQPDTGYHYMNDVVFGMYTEAFFAENFLVIFFFYEPSGGIGHRVDAFLSNGDIYVTRFKPEAGPGDMAGWHMILEVDGRKGPKQLNLIVDTERV